jgi:ABC-2 type transport system ATP-binding protein
MDAVVTVRDLWKIYPGGKEAVRGISFEVGEGEFFGFLGPNGAGKSTTIKVLTTLLRATRGEATIFGHDVGRDANFVRRVIGYAAQEVGVDDELTGRENLALQGQLYHMDFSLLRRRVDELLELVDLTADADRLAGSYSGGMRKRLDLATGLIHQPQVLFLDEPTSGLDPQNRAGIWAHLERLNKEEKLTLFLTTHYLEEADRLCDRVAIIDHGTIIASGTPADLKGELGGGVISLAFRSENGGAEAERERAAEILRSRCAHLITDVKPDNGRLLITAGQGGGKVLPQILRELDEAGLHVDDLSLSSPSLDDVFLKHTGEHIREDTPVENWRNSRAGWGPMRPAPTRRRQG